MAALPSGLQVAGSHLTTYESIFRQVDKNGTGKIGAAEAALFLKKSGLKETLLHKIWELSDPSGKGFLDKQGMFVALKLISLAQNGHDVTISNLTVATPIPNMSGIPSAAIPRPATPPTDNLWAITPEEKTKFDNIFNGLQPIDNKLSGDKVKTVFMNSKLPVDVLSRIWDLSDIDKDGLLDREEFAVAMYLVYKALEKEPTPMVLPPRLLPPSKRKKPAPLPGTVPVLPGPASAASIRGRATPPIPVSTATIVKEGSPKGSPTLQPKQPLGHSTWVVTAQEKANFDMIFKTLDTNNDGLVSGEEVRPTLVQSGLQQPVLAHIWNLCDMKKAGMLNSEQFALAMYLIQQCKNGVSPPQQLTPEMIPPTSRPKPLADQGLAGLDLGAPGGPTSGISESISEAATAAAAAGDYEAIKELDTISKEIEGLKHEKSELQEDITEKEEQMQMKSLEVKGLQIELDQATLQVKQLETQKSEAQKKLDELDQQKSTLEDLLGEVKEQCRDLQTNVDELRIKVSSQETSVKAQEEELNRVRIELNTLRQEEVKLEKELDASKGQLNTVTENVKVSEQELQQLESKLSVLRDGKQKMGETISQYDSAIDTASSTGSLPNVDDLGPIATNNDNDVFSSRATAGSSSPVSTLSEFSIASKTDDFKDDPFKGKDPFGGEAIDGADPFQTSDPFKGDPFKNEGFTSDPFGGDPFKSNTSEDPFKSTADPFTGTDGTDFFKGADPFSNSDKSDPFKSTESGADPFKSSNTSDPFKSTGGSDPFKSSDGADPFQSTVDPFKGSDSSADPFKSTDGADLFKTKDGSDPFQGAGSDPFANTTQEDPFKSSDPFGGTSGGGSNSSDPFGGSGGGGSKSSDPFGGSASGSKTSDPFGGTSGGGSQTSDPFGGSASGGGSDPFGSGDPFKSSDPFQGEAGLTNGQADSGKSASGDLFGSIDPFGGDAFSKTSSASDAFGSEPFKSSEETPALPPKKVRATPPAKTGTASPITSSTTAPSLNNDAFAAFGSDSASDPFASTAGAVTTKSSDDPFGGDPFAGSNASDGGFGAKDPFGGSADTGDAFGASDPFGGTDSGFGKDPFGGSSTTGTTDGGFDKDPFGGSSATTGGTDSAFGGQDPFGGSATTTSSGGKDGGKADPFADFADFGNVKFEMTEEEQLAWAVKDSEKERERQHKLAQQEENDLQKALSLSQVDTSSTDA